MYELIADMARMIEVYETAIGFLALRLDTLLKEKAVSDERALAFEAEAVGLRDHIRKLNRELDAAVEDCRKRDLEIKEMARALQIAECRLVREMFPGRFNE